VKPRMLCRTYISLTLLYKKPAGLMGGHSGLNIGEGRGNAVVFAARIADAVVSGVPGARLAAIIGGDKRNCNSTRGLRYTHGTSLVRCKEMILEGSKGCDMHITSSREGFAIFMLHMSGIAHMNQVMEEVSGRGITLGGQRH